MKYSIGRGKKYSIAKAALIFYYEVKLKEYANINAAPYLDYGELDDMHEIVEIAGAKQMSSYTPAQVSGRLANSPYWDKKYIAGFYAGMRGHGGANVYRPSKKGEKYYHKKLKNRQSKNN